MQIRLAFQQTSDEQLLVLTEHQPELFDDQQYRRSCAVTTFEHEDVFLERVVAADLDETLTRELVTTVILTVAQRGKPNHWLQANLTPRQIADLGLQDVVPPAPPSDRLPSGFADNLTQFYEFLMQAPTPFVMLAGPQHVVTFINQQYVDLIGQTSREDVLGRPVRAVLPELEGQPFFGLLDDVYRTQKPFVGVEVPARLRRPYGGGYDDRHFDFIYHPVIAPDGETTGILVQATDVSEKVLAREVSERREQQLFRQWVELDTIYRTSPAAMALFSAGDLKILRLNDRQAEWMGLPESDLLGRSITSLPFHSAQYVALLRRVAAGETMRDCIFRDTLCPELEPVRTWRLSLSPFLNSSGEVEAVTSIAFEEFSRPEPVCDLAAKVPEPVC